MPSVVGICNLALNRIGDDYITDLTEGTKQATTCNVIYEPIRDGLIAAHGWNFAFKRAVLARLATTPAFGYDFEYQLPSDLLRIWEVADSKSDFEREGRKLLINDTSVNLRYIFRVTDPGAFSPSFIESLSLAIAAQLAERLAKSRALKVDLLTELEQVSLPRAHKVNAIEDHPRNPNKDYPVSEFSWQKTGKVTQRGTW